MNSSLCRSGSGGTGSPSHLLHLGDAALGDDVPAALGPGPLLDRPGDRLPVPGQPGQRRVHLAVAQRPALAEVRVVVPFQVIAVARPALKQPKQCQRNTHTRENTPQSILSGSSNYSPGGASIAAILSQHAQTTRRPLLTTAPGPGRKRVMDPMAAAQSRIRWLGAGTARRRLRLNHGRCPSRQEAARTPRALTRWARRLAAGRPRTPLGGGQAPADHTTRRRLTALAWQLQSAIKPGP